MSLPPLPLDSAYGAFMQHPHVIQDDLGEQWLADDWQDGVERALQAERSSIDDEDLTECVRTWEALPRGNEATSPNHLVHLQLSRMSRQGSASEKAFAAAGDAGPVLCLNVGGTVFRATEATLRKAPFFESLLRHAQGGKLGTTMDSNGRFFVDRSGDLFAYILEYLRCGHWLLGPRASDHDFVIALREEAGFYGLDLVAGLPLLRISEYVTVWQFRDDGSLYVDCLEQTIREDPDHQGLFRLCKYSGGLPLDQQTCTRRFKATSHSVQSVIAYFAMRGFRLQHVVQGSVITHVTSADGQSRNGPAVQFLLCRLSSFPTSRTPPNSHRN
mmetsp:Transcript_41272/g.94987  ORF Transcript_41272/g.94987 Transcript_41272/m.94987 type:complete len:329 (+) Transcript_41272:107-1093(+)